jgi:hypothetical protein
MTCQHLIQAKQDSKADLAPSISLNSEYRERHYLPHSLLFTLCPNFVLCVRKEKLV